MTISTEERQNVLNTYQRADGDTGSTEVQVALLTTRIKNLTEHFKTHKKDLHSRYGLQTLVNRRRKLLKYFKHKSYDQYRELISKLSLRDSY